ncbi:hypothetical protein [Streptomyces sp. NBC_00572]|uniref:hypothetical protein n=1 Tax=Streptomyces sp. NBC_00572 TaxID=2903664 RepID=UPI0022517F2B|nr:hypothetical protein [Streptomyces sp. NBC_00572]MCX4986349.1 hypothetical protein [Streptomyces sp. NBC_00572]
MPSEPSVLQTRGDFAVLLGGAIRRRRSLGFRFAQDRPHVIRLERSDEDAIRLLLAVEWRSRYTREGSPGTEHFRRLTSPEPGNNVSLIAEEIVDLFSTPEVQFEVLVFPLESSQFVGQLGALSGCGGGDDQMASTERSSSARERLHSLPQVPRGELLVVLALDDDEATVRIAAGKVDAVLDLSLHPIPAKLDPSDGEDAA